jgi:hypothetical protein
MESMGRRSTTARRSAGTGTLNQSVSPAVWTLTGTAGLRNPAGPAASAIRRSTNAQVRVTPVYQQGLDVPVATPGDQGAYATAQPPQSFSG